MARLAKTPEPSSTFISPKNGAYVLFESKRQLEEMKLQMEFLRMEAAAMKQRRVKTYHNNLPRKYMTKAHKEHCTDDGDQAIRVVGGGFSDEEYMKLGGTSCPFCRAEESCYHDSFYKEDIPVKDGMELHASVCDKCSETWYDVIETETGILLGTRHVDWNGVRLPKLEPATT